MTGMSTPLSFGKSDVGLKRSNNEDSFIIKPDLGFLALADGMGGAAAGEVASQIFIDAAMDVFSRNARPSEQEAIELIQETFQLANERIQAHVKKNSHHEGMGCTAELIAFRDQFYFLGHVGDSRTYLFRQGKLRQLTQDHSLVQDQVNQGLITPVEARKHPLKNVILRSVGVSESLAVDLLRGRSFPGDFFLLCSDGLTDMVEDSSIQKVLTLSISLSQKVERLIEFAKSAGGYDNITVILCEVTVP